MSEEDKDVAEDTNSEVDEVTNSNEEPVEKEDTEAIKASLADALKAKAELTARAKRAEEELKTLKAKPQEKINCRHNGHNWYNPPKLNLLYIALHRWNKKLF